MSEAMLRARQLRPDICYAPVIKPLTAGVIDDNADFGEYLAFRHRHAGLNVRDRDVRERYRLLVQDAVGRPVPDAVVSVWADGQAQPLWARTDAGGEAWLHPAAAGLSAPVLELRASVSSDGRTWQGTAQLHRGQRDAVQLRMNFAGPPGPARLDLVFLVDATASMQDEINQLRRSVETVAREISRLPSAPDLCLALVTYRDHGEEFVVHAWDFTPGAWTFDSALAFLQASGGGDMPEAMNEALHTAVHRLSWRGDGTTRLIVLLADAPPHLDRGPPWYDDDMQAALARGIKLFTVAASGLDRSGEAIFRQMAQYNRRPFCLSDLRQGSRRRQRRGQRYRQRPGPRHRPGDRARRAQLRGAEPRPAGGAPGARGVGPPPG